MVNTNTVVNATMELYPVYRASAVIVHRISMPIWITPIPCVLFRAPTLAINFTGSKSYS